MVEEKFLNIIDSFDKAFKQMIFEMSDIKISKCSEKISSGRKFSIIVGLVAMKKGRILFESESNLVDKITEGMNGEPLDDKMDTYFFLLEFANIFCGKAISQINNFYRDTEFRLTPPALFVGDSMRIITPSIRSETITYTSEFGRTLLDIGIEGV